MEFLKTLCLTSSVSAHENDLASLICKEVKDFADEAKIDNIGNVIVHKKGTAKRILFCTPMDECGGLVTFIEKSGKIRFSGIGHKKAENYLNCAVMFKNSVFGIVKCESKNLNELKFSDLYIDTVFSDISEIEKNIEVGDVFSFEPKYAENNNKIITSAGSSKFCVYALCDAIKNIKNNDNDLYFIFATRGEEGNKGVKAAAEAIDADYIISSECCAVNDKNIKDDAGVIINVKDPSFICDKTLLNEIKEILSDKKIKFTLVADVKKSSQAGAVWEHTGLKTACVCLPIRYSDDVYCLAQKNNISEFLKASLEIAKMQLTF